MPDDVRAGLLRALAEAVGACQDAGGDPWAEIAGHARDRGLKGASKGWPAAEVEAVILRLGGRVPEPTPPPSLEQMRESGAITTADRIPPPRPKVVAPEAPPHPPAWPTDRGRLAEATEVRQMLQGVVESAIYSRDDEQECLAALPAVEAWEKAERLRRALRPPPAGRPKGRYPWLKAVEEHYALVGLVRALDEWHRRRGEPTRTDDWDDGQWARVVVFVECRAMAIPGYDGALGPVPDAQALMGPFLEDCTLLARSAYGVAAPTPDQMVAVVDRVWREAIGGVDCPVAKETLLATLESLARGGSLQALRLAALQARREVAEIEAVRRTGGAA